MVENLLSITRVGGEGTPIQKCRSPWRRSWRTRCESSAGSTRSCNGGGRGAGGGALRADGRGAHLPGAHEPAGERGPPRSDDKPDNRPRDVRCGPGKFVVEDDGGGIDAEALPLLFEDKPAGAAPVDSKGRHNMGIGLTVCRTIVKAHGGDMSAANGRAEARCSGSSCRSRNRGRKGAGQCRPRTRY